MPPGTVTRQLRHGVRSSSKDSSLAGASRSRHHDGFRFAHPGGPHIAAGGVRVRAGHPLQTGRAALVTVRELLDQDLEKPGDGAPITLRE